MLDKIYSRPRIKIKSLRKMSRKEKLKFGLKLILIFLFLFSIFVIKAAYPIFIASCENAASSSATSILNKEVNEVMLVYNYNDLVNLGKDEIGNITYIEAKIMPINEIVAKITNNIQEKLDLNTTISVNLNFGSISGISGLSGISPNFKVAMERAGSVDADIDSEFIAVGINQTLHRIYLVLKCDIGILTPFQTVKKEVETKVLLTETVIVGDVPTTYYNYDNLGFNDVLKTLK